ncbi:hypothetical protein IPV08_16050 [Methylobacterium sp. SD274]|uniref:hypothetical protein n=1 Tax=Methylobacterium sp. SD274 TaxID=2782009 RepID=UPI001A968758|nr:hypothetical protein [Methylobacterium sp. SD274]MBO1021474.1 hypothetical protein [Methylobacterium sp. SD274]
MDDENELTMVRWGTWAGLALTLVFLAGGTWALTRKPFDRPNEALAVFYGSEPDAECMLTAPLHRAGKAVAPLIIAELPNRAMPRRRYAIEFLGEGGYREALPVLEMIARNSAELEYFRGDALLAISEIDLSLARKVASGLTDTTGHLGGIAKAVLQGGSTLSVLINRSCV